MSKGDIALAWIFIILGLCGFLEFLIVGNYIVIAHMIAGMGVGVSVMRLLHNRRVYRSKE